MTAATFADSVRDTVATLPASTVLWLAPSDFRPGDVVVMGGACMRTLLAPGRKFDAYDIWSVAKPAEGHHVGSVHFLARGDDVRGHLVIRASGGAL